MFNQAKYFLVLKSQWYNRNGWLGIKHQVTFLFFALNLISSVGHPCRFALYQWRSEKGRLVTCFIHLSHIPIRPVHDVTFTDRWVQNGSIHGRVSGSPTNQWCIKTRWSPTFAGCFCRWQFQPGGHPLPRQSRAGLWLRWLPSHSLARSVPWFPLTSLRPSCFNRSL